ncbi:uncharacterized protein AB675_1006 [Cyphellophora attinorum]|uniref:Uncharacterized protein n=1 Tax=Cyphellophora attinorum TaxID=1664694 RepID=A0A0N0NKP2_9EURO|nr:uncharacterized protein AB675_1006 [Phialophora attinorum]KPI38069.1 hypothetical protein AB675_1006 [Phialophora attinorum]
MTMHTRRNRQPTAKGAEYQETLHKTPSPKGINNSSTKKPSPAAVCKPVASPARKSNNKKTSSAARNAAAIAVVEAIDRSPSFSPISPPTSPSSSNKSSNPLQAYDNAMAKAAADALADFSSDTYYTESYPEWKFRMRGERERAAWIVAKPKGAPTAAEPSSARRRLFTSSDMDDDVYVDNDPPIYIKPKLRRDHALMGITAGVRKPSKKGQYNGCHIRVHKTFAANLGLYYHKDGKGGCITPKELAHDREKFAEIGIDINMPVGRPIDIDESSIIQRRTTF